MLCVKKDVPYNTHLSNEFMRNLEVFAEAVRFYRRVLEFASGNLKNDAKNVIKAVQKTN